MIAMFMNLLLYESKTGGMFDNSLFDNSFGFVCQLKNGSF
jgi:hypothetical protein